MSGIATVSIGDNQWQVSVASTYQERAAGLGGLISIPAGTGMLFVFSGSQWVTVTTEPMLFNLDIVFLDENFRVTEVHRNVPPGRMVTALCRYFLEVTAGETEDVEVGSQARADLPPIDGPIPILEPMIMMLITLTVLTGAFSAVGKL